MMKKIFTLLIAAMVTISSFTQISDSVNMMPYVSQDIYYSLDNGTVKSVAGEDWTIAFATSGFSVSAYINDGRGVELYETTIDTADFATVDTAGMDFSSNYNGYTDWSSGAFENNSTGGLNYGWGNYNTTTHAIEGTRVYVLKALSGEFFKIVIVEKAGGIWSVKYDKLDNSNLQVVSLDGASNTDKNFVYLDVDNDVVTLDREPVSTDWDLEFTKYYDTSIPYKVTGVLANNGLEIAQVDGESTATSTYTSATFTNNISEIGSDWKEYDFSSGGYVVEADRTYFIKKDMSTIDDEIYNYYKLVFTGFGGNTTGKVYFTVELVVSDTIINTTIEPVVVNSIADSVDMLPSVAQDVFYSLDNGTVKSEDGNDWTIAFATNAFSVSAYINDGRGVELYETTYDIADFATVDTAGMDFTSNYNEYANWTSSAFEKNGTGGTNYGWGDYNTVSHVVAGTRVYVLKALSGDFFKIIIEEKAMGVWKVKYDKLDNSNLQVATIDGASNTDKSFVYLNMDNDVVTLDREPASVNWDLKFTKYFDTSIPYKVTGVLVNEGLEIAQVDGVDTATSTYVGETFTQDVNEIGSDWKEFNMGTYAYDVVVDRTYFIKKDMSTATEDIYNYYKVIFTGFGGNATGKVYFTVELLATDSVVEEPVDPTGINDLENLNVVSIYPNPATELAHVLIDGKTNTSATITISNTIGQTVYAEPKELKEGLNAINLNVSAFDKGLYFVQIQSEGKSKVLKLQVK